MVERKKTLGIPMSEEEHEQIRKLAERNGMTMSAYVRFIIRQIIEKENEE